MTVRPPSRITPWLATLVLLGSLVVGIAPAPGAAQGQKERPGGPVAGRYIVAYKAGVSAAAKTGALARAAGAVKVRHVYTAALTGFAAELTEAQLAALLADPDVASVTPDYRVYAFADSLPTGIRRSEAYRSPVAQVGAGSNPVDVDVAIIDSGIVIDHPDLNVAGGVSCVPGEPSYDDRNGHGTHVAGTVGALDNGAGVIGVAPGARVWAVRVLNAAGEGDFSDVICGIDWVTANAGTIEIANMSLGGPAPEGDCNDGSLHQAICASIAAGVTYVVAAGNSAQDAADVVPASFDEVLTVSAIVDTDGKPGGTGPHTFFFGADDALATFSNFGHDIDIAAPGYAINSTWLNGGYFYSSGTSMAAPHVAGAAALYLMANPGASPAEVMAGVLAAAWPGDSPQGFTGDVDAYKEPVLNAGAIGGGPVQPSCTLDDASVTPGDTLGFSCIAFTPSEVVKVYLDSTASTMRGMVMIGPVGTGAGSLLVPDMPIGAHTAIFVGSTSGAQVSRPLAVEPSSKITNGTTGKVGAMAMVQVRGYGAAENVDLRWVPAAGAPATVRTFATGSTGTGTSFITIPEAAAGTYTVQAVGLTSGALTTTAYTVIPSVAVSLPYVKPGQSTTVSLRGFTPGETVEVRWYADATTASVIGTATVSALGSATFSIVVPAATYGAHTVEAVGSAGSTATTVVNIQAGMTMTPAMGSAGTPITIVIGGYRANESVVIRWYDTTTTWTPVTMATTDATGGVTVTFPAPAAVAGTHKVEAVSASNLSNWANFWTMAGMSATPTSGSAGTSVTVAFTGYKPGETVSARWYTSAYAYVTVGTAVASASGAGTITFVVPPSTVGLHKIETFGSVSAGRASMNFTYN